jgi:Flp pilus assembly protein TadB
LPLRDFERPSGVERPESFAEVNSLSRGVNEHVVLVLVVLLVVLVLVLVLLLVLAIVLVLLVVLLLALVLVLELVLLLDCRRPQSARWLKKTKGRAEGKSVRRPATT